jgi:hypothetical protein
MTYPLINNSDLPLCIRGCAVHTSGVTERDSVKSSELDDMSFVCIIATLTLLRLPHFSRNRVLSCRLNELMGGNAQFMLMCV